MEERTHPSQKQTLRSVALADELRRESTMTYH
jgi:hypothetical protein